MPLCPYALRRPEYNLLVANSYRRLPSVDRVLADERVRALSAEYSGDTVVALVREALRQQGFPD